MKRILVVAEREGRGLRHPVFEILGRLREGEISVAVPGGIDAESLAELRRHGVDRVIVLEAPGAMPATGEGLALGLEQLLRSEDFDAVIGAATLLGRDLFPRLGAALDRALAADVVDFELEAEGLCAVKPVYGGRCLARLRTVGPRPHLLSVRPRVLRPGHSPRTGEGRVVHFQVQAQALRLELLGSEPPVSSGPDLAEADVVVAGGRPLRSAENLKLLEDLAREVGGAIGASRGAVDCGFAPRSALVGQSGKTISPALYIACGISGAIHHYAGIRNARVILAINTDPEAPIFRKADYGILGDMFQVVPALTRALRRARRQQAEARVADRP